MSIFTEYLFYLTKISRNIDTCRVTNKEWIELQGVESRIINGLQKGYYDYKKYRILMNLYYPLRSEYPKIIKLNEDVAQIETEIDRQRKSA